MDLTRKFRAVRARCRPGGHLAPRWGCVQELDRPGEGARGLLSLPLLLGARAAFDAARALRRTKVGWADADYKFSAPRQDALSLPGDVRLGDLSEIAELVVEPEGDMLAAHDFFRGLVDLCLSLCGREENHLDGNG